MARRLVARPGSITFVTGNAGKVEEMRRILDPLGIAVVQDERGYPEIQNDELRGVTEAGAGYLAATGVEAPYMLEDAGLFIDALRGFPGVYSSYVLGTLGCAGILRQMQDIELEMRTASFQADLCYVDADGAPHHFAGTCKGRIATRAAGDRGFGFDPIFIPDGHDKTFAELPAATKDQVSHRGQAVAGFTSWLRDL